VKRQGRKGGGRKGIRRGREEGDVKRKGRKIGKAEGVAAGKERAGRKGDRPILISKSQRLCCQHRKKQASSSSTFRLSDACLSQCFS